MWGEPRLKPSRSRLSHESKIRDQRHSAGVIFDRPQSSRDIELNLMDEHQFAVLRSPFMRQPPSHCYGARCLGHARGRSVS